ncbi:MAG TPA: hypothetical protein VKV05_00755 [Terriglobales bacterium]|nr:hypothetical protein [Terriglobales bacterium]
MVVIVAAFALPALSQSNWTTVVNNGDVMPGTTNLFNSYNQPSVNAFGLVVFRARSKGGNGEPVHGIYTRNMLVRNSPLNKVFDRTSEVPQPNNNAATFIEFPAFPRIDLLSSTLVTRGNSQPVWTYTLADGTETKAGTSGVFVEKDGSYPTAATQLGSVTEFSYFQTPGAVAETKFDQFPGAPAVSGSRVVFKGNYTEDTLAKTGVYFRDISSNGGLAPTRLIANTSTRIPNQPRGGHVTFGSTAPPSAALGFAVFAGFDNEDNPTRGGIYWAPLIASPSLTTLVGIGSQVPGEANGVTFTKFGESLSFDGRYVAFWGAWGTEVNNKLLLCPTDGNKDLIQYCNNQYPYGYTASVPVHQGIFVYDILTTRLAAVAKSPNNYDDFVYWTFSGKVPGVGNSDDGEPARWRSSAFTAVSGRLLTFQVIFKATKNGVDGIYHTVGPRPTSFTTLVDTTMAGTALDAEAPAGSKVTAVGIERDGFRLGWLTLTASMLDPVTSESWGGIYIQYLP